MVVTQESILKMTPSEIRSHYREDGHFFDRDTMRFFGDTMASFGVKTVNGNRYLYRKPSATVNVFGQSKRAGREFFGAWRVVPLDSGSIDLNVTLNEEEQMVYDAV